jgi:hypothetical protein
MASSAQVLFDNHTDGLESADFSVPVGFIAFFRVASYDGKVHCLDLIEVLAEPQQSVVGGVACDGSVAPGFLDGDVTTVPHYKRCDTALMSTGSTNWTLSFVGVYRLRLRDAASEKNVYVSVDLVPVGAIPPTWGQYELGTQDCGCDGPVPCPSYPMGGGFVYGPGDVLDPEATVEFTACRYDGAQFVFHMYPAPGTYAGGHATYLVEACGEIFGWAANWSACGQNPNPSCGC